MYINLITIDLCPGQSGGGVTPSGTLNISENGEYDVYSYSNAVVDVPAGWDQKSFTEGVIKIINLDNTASFVAGSAFDTNQTIKTVNLPYATSVGTYAFRSCRSLSQVSLPVCSYIDDYAFYICYSLSQISIPMCSYIGSGVFSGCSLRQVNLPMCGYINNDAFRSCRKLSQVSLPVCSYIGARAFYQCNSLTNVSLPVCRNIGGAAFATCTSLSIITIGYSSVCSLGGSGAFENTKIASGTGSIYVPASLVDAYKSALNWRYFSSQIFPISE